jgi:hypothetical protein
VNCLAFSLGFGSFAAISMCRITLRGGSNCGGGTFLLLVRARSVSGQLKIVCRRRTCEWEEDDQRDSERVVSNQVMRMQIKERAGVWARLGIRKSF